MRKGCVVTLLVVVGLCALGTVAYRNGVHPKLVLWIAKERWAYTRSFEAQVEANLEIAGIGVSGSGRVRYMRPELYDLDFTNVRLVAGTDALWVVVPAVRTAVRVAGVGITPTQMIDGMLSGWDTADPARWARQLDAASNEVTLFAPQVVDGQRCWVLQWPAKTGERVGGRLYISQRTQSPVRFDQMDPTGQVTQTVQVREYKCNPALRPADFEFHAMSDYRVIEHQYDPSDPLGLEGLLQGTSAEALRLRSQVQEQIEKHLPAAQQWLGNQLQ